MGDGFMASFGSVTKAMDCAIALQRAFAAHTESMPEPLHVRVGLNAGEPIEEDGDLFGSTVILASRIAAKAGAGEILIPEPLRHLLVGQELRLRRPRRDDAQGLRGRRAAVRSALAGVSIARLAIAGTQVGVEASSASSSGVRTLEDPPFNDNPRSRLETRLKCARTSVRLLPHPSLNKVRNGGCA